MSTDNDPSALNKVVHIPDLLVLYSNGIFQARKKAHRAAIAVKRPVPKQAPPVTRIAADVRSDEAWMARDDTFTVKRIQHFLDYAPKIVLPVTRRSMEKGLTDDGKKELDEETKKLLDKSHPARCTSAQYLDRNGNPILFYFGRRLVYKDAKKVLYFTTCLSHLIH